MIACIVENDKIAMVKIKGSWNDLMNEYKAITDYFLENHFNEFMAAMDQWNNEVKNND